MGGRVRAERVRSRVSAVRSRHEPVGPGSIGLPDDDCRVRLFQLYLRDLPSLDAGIDLAPLVAATDGVSAAFIKELTRRAVLLAAVESGDQTTAPTVAARHLTQGLAALESASAPIRRTLLGAQPTT
jgi:SpoVK/Ycf46/Vps4 family AAA+-type ATPase